MILVFLSLVLIAASVSLLASAVLKSGVRRSENLEHIASYGYVDVLGDDGSTRRGGNPLDGLAAAVGAIFAGRLGGSLREEDIQRRLLSAGFFGIGARRFNRLPDPADRRAAAPDDLATRPGWGPGRSDRVHRSGERNRRLGRAERRSHSARQLAASGDRRRVAGADRPPRGDARGRGVLRSGAADLPQTGSKDRSVTRSG